MTQEIPTQYKVEKLVSIAQDPKRSKGVALGLEGVTE